jgi:hypothetical protein
MLFSVTEHFVKTARHASFYLASGPEAGPLIIFVHGWPELSHSWRHQLRCFAALGFRCVAPDMRGYGRSSHYDTHADYALEHSVDDMLELLAHLGRLARGGVGRARADKRATVGERCEGRLKLNAPPRQTRQSAPLNAASWHGRKRFALAPFPPFVPVPHSAASVNGARAGQR